MRPNFDVPSWIRGALGFAGLVAIFHAASSQAGAAMPAVGGPGKRAGHTFLHDPVRDRMILFGGQSSDVWALSLATPEWSILSPTGTPPAPRTYHTAIYDPVRDRMIVFGGVGATGSFNDVWALSLGATPAWSRLSPSGAPPYDRYAHVAIYDPVRDRMVIFGGGRGGQLNDVWALSLGDAPAWTQLSPTGGSPVARFGHTGVYDPVRDRLVIYGGSDVSGNYDNDVWALSLANVTWTQILPSGTLPAARTGHSAVYDPVRDRMLMFGGQHWPTSGSGDQILGYTPRNNDLWGLSLTGQPTWTELTPGGVAPPQRSNQAAAYDPSRDRMVISGGAFGYSDALDDAWFLSLDATPAWTELGVGALPSGRYGHTATYDPQRDRMVVFGGYDYDPQDKNDVWALPLAGKPAWTQLNPTGTAPTPRSGHVAIYDPPRDRMVIFGGYHYPPGDLADVWTLSLGGTPTWSPMTPFGSPSASNVSSAIYDPRRDSMLLSGGAGPATAMEVWVLTLDGASWSQMNTSGTQPPGRYGHSSIYDPVRNRMLVMGGYGEAGFMNDVWALSLGDTLAWSRLEPDGMAPPGQIVSVAAYDETRDRLLFYGGSNGIDDVWELTLGDHPRWNQLHPNGAPPPYRSGHSLIYDRLRDRLVTFGGGLNNDSWALYLSGTRAGLDAPVWGRLGGGAPSINILGDAYSVVTVGDTAAVSISIINLGSDDLHVTAIEVPISGSHLTTPAPFTIPPGGAVPETLFLPAHQPGSIRDTLYFDNDDKTAVRKSVAVNVDILPLEFRSHLLSGSSGAPLGIPIVDLVSPASGVRIESGYLFYRSRGSPAAFDSAVFVRSGGDFVAVIPGAAVGEAGIEYYVRMENSDVFVTDPPGAPDDSLFTQEVSPPDSITTYLQPTSASDFTTDQAIRVEVLLPTGVNFITGDLHYRQGGEDDYAREPLAMNPTLGRAVASIPDSITGARGVEYWVEVRTLTRTLTFPPQDPAGSPATIRIKVPKLVEPRSHSGSRFRMLTVPLDFGSDFVGGLDAILSDQLGPYDPMKWRAFRYDPQTARNVEFSTEDEGFRPVPGSAYWLITRSAHQIDTYPKDGRSTPSDREWRIVLRPGWNQFGNPFEFLVAWSDVRKSSPAIGSPVAFDESAGTIGDYGDAPSLLMPFEGYFIECTSPQPETLYVPPRAAQSGPDGALATAQPRSTTSWSIHVRAQTEHAEDGANLCGVRPQAADDFDPLDQRKPPQPPGPWVRVAFANPEWKKNPGSYRHDLRAPNAEGDSWALELRSANAGESIALELLPEDLPADRVCVLIDRELAVVIDVRPDAGGPSRYEVISLGDQRPYRLTLIAGTVDYVRRAASQATAVPSRVVLDRSAPNPFSSATRIRYGLPREERISLDIYGVTGERVASPLKGRVEQAGYHSIVWDGTGSDGRLLPSGVYYCRLTVGESRLARRLVLVR